MILRIIYIDEYVTLRLHLPKISIADPLSQLRQSGMNFVCVRVYST